MSIGRAAAAVFDPALVREYQQGSARALEFFQNWVDAGRPIGLSATSALDVLSRCRDEEDRADWRFFLSQIAVVLPLTVAVVDRATKLLDTVPLPTRLTGDDALVAATALVRKLPLYSLDPGRYAGVPGLTALPAR